MSAWQDRWVRFLLGLALLWLFLSLAWDPGLWRPDFAHDYAAGLLLRLGRAGEIYAHEGPLLMPREILALVQAHGYPGDYLTRFFGHPIIALLAAPITFLPYSLASAAWFSAQLGLWVGWLLLAFRRDKTLGLALSLVALLFYPLRASLEAGQITGFVVPLTGLFLLRPRRLWAQALLALGLLLKPAAALLLLWPLVERRWRVFLGVIGWLLGFNLITLLAVGPGPLLQHAGLLAERTGAPYLYIKQQSLLAFLYRITHWPPLRWELETALVPLPGWLRLLWLGLAVIIAGLSLWRRRPEVVLLGSLLAVPNAPTDYLALVFIPAVSLALDYKRAKLRTFLLAGLGLALLNLPQSYYIPAAAQVLRFTGTAGLFLMWLGFTLEGV